MPDSLSAWFGWLIAVAIYFVMFGRRQIGDSWDEIREQWGGFRSAESHRALGALKLVGIVMYSLAELSFTLLFWLLAVGGAFWFVTAMGAGNN